MKRLLKRLKGFTLIELLAVIVILAIIALIAVPLILNMIEESRIKSAVISGGNYVKAVNYKIAQEELNGRPIVIDFEDNTYVIGENALEVDADNIENITGEYLLDTVGVTWAGLCVNNYPVVYYNGKASYDKGADYCGGESSHFVEPDVELVSAICESSNGASIYTDNTEFKIKTLEDLACLSETVNGGKNFSGKTIYLVSDIDLLQSSSYKSSSTKKYGDINGDGVINGLKDELTTEAGFKPIGNSNKKFTGSLVGYGFAISNLKINRPSESYVGLFGYNEGNIIGVRLRDANITGGGYTGGIAGYNSYKINDVDVRGTITSTGSIVGGIVGETWYNYSNEKNNNMVFSGTVKGVNQAGGLVGRCGSSNVKGLVYDSTIEITQENGYIGRGVGNYQQYGGNAVMRAYNVNLVYSGNRNGSDGIVLNGLRLHNVDDTIDTYIAGDNDNDGYYFDYDSSNKIVLYSTDRRTIQNKLKGSGTVDSPYIIKNSKDWRMASTTVTQGKYYSVMNDISFGNDYLYALGTSTNKFNGTIDGNMHTLSNINVQGYDYASAFGYNNGTIKNLKFENITVTGQNSNTGVVAGINDGTIDGIVVRNSTISGSSYTGGIVGNNTYKLKNVDVQATVTATGNIVGGIVGETWYNYSNERNNDMVFSGTVKGVSQAGGLAGRCGSGNFKGLVYDSTIEITQENGYIGKGVGNYQQYGNNSTIKTHNVDLTYTGTRNGFDGIALNSLRLHDVDDTIDTYLAGDNDTDGYYFDYDSNNNIILYSAAKNPIQNTLSGEGTEDSPYVVKSLADWKMASATITQRKYYSIESDIDFDNDYLYALGTNTNKFNGNMNGNSNTLSNIDMKGYSYTGLFGYNNGTVQNIKFNNVKVTGQSDYTGIIAGYNAGLINGIIARNATVKGSNYTGGIVGNNTYKMFNVDVRGTITSTGTRVGGIVGETWYNLSQERNSDMAFSGTVKGVNQVGGLVGRCGSSNVKGIVYDSTIQITQETGNVGKAVGEYPQYSNYAAVKTANTTLTYTGDRSGFDGIALSTLRLNNVDDIIDTYIGGENSSDDYYFDYDSNNKIVLYNSIKTPIQNTLSGNGTEASPYIIRNTNDWKMASALCTKGKYFSIESDINFGNDFLYSMGTNTNRFNGNINGNRHTLSNINIKGYNYTGVFGYNSGTIQNFRFNNIRVNGDSEYTGVIAGYNSGTINGIVVRGATISGNNYTGGITGNNTYRIKNVDVQATITSTGNTVGGIVGETWYNYSQERNLDMVFSGSVKGVNQVGGIAGRCGSSNLKGVVYDTTVQITQENGNIGRGVGNYQQYGNYSVVKTNNITLAYTGDRTGFDGVDVNPITAQAISDAIDTSDSDNDGYYFSLSTGKPVLVTN